MPNKPEKKWTYRCNKCPLKGALRPPCEECRDNKIYNQACEEWEKWNKERKHSCEDWYNDGVGCSVCGNAMKGLTLKEIKKAQKYCNWIITSLPNEEEIRELFNKIRKTQNDNVIIGYIDDAQLAKAIHERIHK